MQAVGTSFVTLGPSVRDTQDRRAVPLPCGGVSEGVPAWGSVAFGRWPCDGRRHMTCQHPKSAPDVLTTQRGADWHYFRLMV